MKDTKIFLALGCALLAVALVGCGQTNNLQSIAVTAAQVDGTPVTSQSGFVTLEGNGGTIQLAVTGQYSDGKTKDLTSVVKYTVLVDPDHNVDAFGNTLLPPCTPGTCPNPTQPPPYTSGTLEYNTTGLLTAVEPATCTWIDVEPLDQNGNPQTPSWFYTGDYVVTATFGTMVSQPFFVPIASSGGNQFYNGQENNPSAACGPTPTS